MSEDGQLGNWLAGVLFERRHKGNQTDQDKAPGLLRSLYRGAVGGAVVMLAADYLISAIVPQYWPPGHHGAVALGGAMAGVWQPLQNWFKARRQAENSG